MLALMWLKLMRLTKRAKANPKATARNLYEKIFWELRYGMRPCNGINFLDLEVITEMWQACLGASKPGCYMAGLRTATFTWSLGHGI